MIRRPTALRLGVLVAVVMGSPLPGRAQDARIDTIFARWDRPGSPGCAIGVVRDGHLLYERGYGMANLDYDIPNSPAMVYYIGSVSKQFTAASVALLAAEGRITLDDDIRDYIPELPDYGRPITIRHLIHHTSGLRDIYVLMDLAGIRMQDVFPDEDALALIARQKELNFQPGDAYLYSNTGYWLLGQIVERVSGVSLREYARTRIFEPLGMTHTHFHDEPGHPMKHRAISYVPAGGDGFRVAYIQNFDKIGAGGLYTTVGDLLAWDANFYDPRVGGGAFLEQIHTRGVLTSGDTLPYAFGQTLGQYRGLSTVRHGGSLMGYRAEFLRFPDQRLSVAVLCNLGSINPGPLAERIAEVHLGDLMEAPPARSSGAPGPARRPSQPQPPAISAEALVDYAGSFRSDEVDATYDVVLAEGGLVLHRPAAEPAPLVPTAADEFRAGNLGLRFARDAAGRVTGFTVQAGRVRNIRFDRTGQAGFEFPAALAQPAKSS